MTGTDDEVYDKVVEMYQAGARLKDITAVTGVPRPTIYWALQKRGLKPSRERRSVEEVNTSQVLEQLAAANREIGRLTTLLEQAVAEIARLKSRKRST
jgi:hypothetical protein